MFASSIFKLLKACWQIFIFKRKINSKPRKMNKRILLFSALGFITISIVAAEHLSAQDLHENNFTLYRKSDGLSSDDITGIIQDSIGYIWASTSSGLNRFNGSNFVQFHSRNDSLSLPGEYLKGVVWIDSNRLCVYGDGLHIVDTRTGERRNVFIPYTNEQYQYKFNWIMAVAGDKAGDIFVLARSGFYHFDKNYHLVFRYDHYKSEEISSAAFVFGRYLLRLDEQRLAVIASTGIYSYDISNRKFKKMDSADFPLLSEFLDYPKKDYQFYEYKKGGIIILKPSDNSAFYVDVSNNRKTTAHIPYDEFDYRSRVMQFDDSVALITGKTSGFYKMIISPSSETIKFYTIKYLQFYSCHQLLKDNNNNLWIATNKGLLHQFNNRSYVRQVPIPIHLQNLFPNITIDDVYGFKDKLYVSTRGNGGLLVYDKQHLQFIKRIGFENYWPQPDHIYAVSAVNNHTLLVATSGPLFELNTETESIKEVHLEKWNRNDGWISDLCNDQKNNVWIAAENIYKYETSTGKIFILPAIPKTLDYIERVQIIKTDVSGNVWLAGHGLLRYNVGLDTYDKIVDSFPFIKMPDRQVNSFIIDGLSNVWVNTNNNGLVCYNLSNKTFRLFTRDNGLPDNNIASMVILKNKLWLATFSGIACVDLKTFQIASFGKEDGFPDQPIHIGAKFFYDSTAGKLYIGFANTIVQFDPNIVFQKSEEPHLFIESVMTDDQKKNFFPQNNFTTSWRNNEITINIGTINFFTAQSQRFAYRLIKNDSSPWLQLGNQNRFTISNLSPGDHHIQVKLFSANNQWNEQIKKLDLIVSPPFWRQQWFIIISIIILLALIYLLIKWRIEQIRRKESAKTAIEKLRAEEFKNRFELEQIINYFSSSLQDKKNLDEVLWDVSKNLIGRMNYEDCMIYMWNANKTKMIQKASHGPKGDPKAINESQFDVLPGQGIVGHVAITKEPLIVPDTRNDERYRIDDIKRLSEICVPIIHNNELMGIIDSEHPDVNHYTERDIKILTTIANLVGNKIKQIESEQSLDMKQKEIAFINQQLAEAQLIALQTQMNPHFIFNSLNSIKGMILDNEQQRASRYMSKFANLLRITLNQSKEVFTTLDENMEHLENYLAMEKLRFDDSFTFRITAQDDIDKEDTLIPTMMIQPLAENAVWHGLMPKKGKKKLSIHFSKMGECISCIVEDNGIGINHSEQLKKMNRPLHKSVGLSNLRNRIKILNEKYDTGCSLEIFDLQDIDNSKTGSCAALTFRIITNKPLI
jgi:ligand-binding sensor domain-containing protein/putative methionine-R-sulfoxide reductase with GAF domain